MSDDRGSLQMKFAHRKINSALLVTLVVGMLLIVVTAGIDHRGNDPGYSRGAEGFTMIGTSRPELVHYSTYVFLARIVTFDGQGESSVGLTGEPRNFYTATTSDVLLGNVPNPIVIGQEGAGDLFEGDALLEPDKEYLILAGNTASLGF